jgi:hypothetical protein
MQDFAQFFETRWFELDHTGGLLQDILQLGPQLVQSDG